MKYWKQEQLSIIADNQLKLDHVNSEVKVNRKSTA